MSLTDFRPEFDNAYQEIFQKVIVSKEIMNTRFESKLRFGESVERVSYDISAVYVRDVTRGSASTIDTITDSAELLNINLEKEAVFHISDGEVTQAGPLNPGEVIGGKIAHKVALDLDGRCFAEVQNAANTFDNGDLTTLASTGTPITLSSTTVPQMTTRMAAKLRYAENQEVSTNMALVVDAYAAADVEQYLMGKDIDIAGSVFKNGYAGVVRNATMYVSEALLGEAVLGLATQPTANDTITVNGLTYTFVASPSAEGDVDLGANVAETRDHLVNALNGDSASAGTDYIAWTGSDLNTFTALNMTATESSDDVVIECIGSGRLIVSETLTDGTDAWDKNFIHAYFGKKGAIDLVVQDMAPVDMRKTDDRRGTNVFSSYLAGIRTFTDGSKKFLDVHIAV